MNLTADLLCEFFEVAVHTILQARKLYPQEIFVKKKKYGVIVYQSEHPVLNAYITQTLKAVHFHASFGSLRSVYVSITAKRKLIERFVFNVLHLKKDLDRCSMFVLLEQNLRALCLKLSTSNVYLNKIPEDAEFNIQILTTRTSSVAFNENLDHTDFPWIAIEDESAKSSPDIVPVYTVDCDEMKLQVFIEKSDNN